ncbi:hypothetical protein BGZ72_008191 [Mortierella alpina]|nr:hypothetical protein BGZ72_008191 [Mortierella alpina]
MNISADSDNVLYLLAIDHASDRSALCTNLRRLEFKDRTYESKYKPSRHIAALLDLNRHLTHLRILADHIFDSSATRASLSKLQNLQHLSIHPYALQDGKRAISLLLQACLPLPNLTELLLGLDMVWESDDEDEDEEDKAIPDLDTIIEVASVARFSRNPSAVKIKSLQLPTTIHGEENPLPLLLLESNLLDLESCQIPWFDSDTHPRDVEHIVRKHCPNLKHLSCPSFDLQEQDGEAACAFIRGCSGLQSFVSKQFFSDQDAALRPLGIISELVSVHFNTLQEFALIKCCHMSSHDQQEILSRCKQLKRFWVVDGRYSWIGINLPDICRGDWVCSELTELGLTLNRLPRDQGVLDAADENAQSMAVAAKRPFEQIARLQKLEVLALDINTGYNSEARADDHAWDLTLSKGWLGELTGLKNLRSLSLPAGVWSMMSQAEVEFMLKHWPLLNEVTLRGKPSGYNSSWRLGSHWQWLVNQRPQLRFSRR